MGEVTGAEVVTEISDHYVYRFFDENDDLLYIGCTVDFRQRWRAHARKQTWWPRVARCSLTGPLPSREAYAWEAAAILVEEPRHNSPSTVRTLAVKVPADLIEPIADAAEMTANWRKKRDSLICQAIARGGAVRAVARLAGLDHSTVLAILKRDGGAERPADHPR